MKLVFVRHGDPDYVHDSLTAKGRVEAEILSGRIAGMKVRDFYCSPLGRAQETAAYSLEKIGLRPVHAALAHITVILKQPVNPVAYTPIHFCYITAFLPGGLQG